MSTQWVHVELPGHGTFWTPESVLCGEAEGPIAPEDHIVDGQLDDFRCFTSSSYAYAFPDHDAECGGPIKRFGQIIGNVADLKRIPDGG